MFVGRKKELTLLSDKFSSPRTEVISLYGRRRVGKSQLIFEAAKAFAGIVISYACYDSSYRQNLDALEAEVKKAAGNEFLHVSSLEEIILFLYDLSKEKPVLLAIDEYPYMREGEKTDSEIKNALDKINLKGAGNPFKFLLCGSSIDIMSILDDEDMPLHGRLTARINLQELNYLESACFYPNASPEEKIAYYGCFGGIPYFLMQIDEKKDFKGNIVDLYLSNHALLATEIRSQIDREVSKIEKAPAFLDILRNKTLSYTDLLARFRSCFASGNVDYCIRKLSSLGILEKVLDRQNNGSSRPYYRIKQNAFRFYYSYLNAPKANASLFDPEDYYDEFLSDALQKEFLPAAFEGIAMEFLSIMNQKKRLPFRLVDLFSYSIHDPKTKANYQFDVVGKTKEGHLINFECKYRKTTISENAVEKEKRQAELADSSFTQTVFISKSSLEKETAPSYSIEDLFLLPAEGDK